MPSLFSQNVPRDRLYEILEYYYYTIVYSTVIVSDDVTNKNRRVLLGAIESSILFLFYKPHYLPIMSVNYTLKYYRLSCDVYTWDTYDYLSQIQNLKKNENLEIFLS